MNSATFRFSTAILRRLGEELITSLDQGIVELAKNSYDADARTCTVELIDTSEPGGTVVITDDGDGMTPGEIQNGWLVVGRSRKSQQSRTRLNRLPAGSKGLGRLGALRMGEEVLLSTRPLGEPGAEYSVHIRWSDYERTDVVEDVVLEINRSESRLGPGTRIEIRCLRNAITTRAAQRLARELLLLADPFGDPAGFKPQLVAPEFERLEDLVRRAYFDDCELRLTANLDRSGRASAKVFDRSGDVRWAADEGDLPSPYQAPPTSFELWVFLLQGSSFAGRAATVGEVRAWLQQFGGVHLYHRGLRVRPYGDPGHDWLDMNLARSRDPELRPSTNTSVGRLTVLDEGQELLQKTDRSGFLESEGFRELRRFAADTLNWMHDVRLAEREGGKAEKRVGSAKRANKARTDLHRTIAELPPDSRPAVESAAREFESASASEREQLQEELGLYQTLASVGTTVSVLAHEIEGPADDLTVSVKTVERRSRRALGDKYELTLGRPVMAIKRSAARLARFATLPIGILERSKRDRKIVDVNEAVEETVTLFEPHLMDARIETIREFCGETARVHGSEAAIESIVLNLLTNSVKAFRRQDSPSEDRKVIVQTEVTDSEVSIVVMDSGPGFPVGLGERIWLPGFTADDDGTGLGLTIVRDTVAELRGRASAMPSSELGGAGFVITLPRAGLKP